MRFLAGRVVALAHTFATDDETPLTPTTVTVTVTREGETTPAASGPAIKAGTSYSFNAGLLAEGVYTVSWDGSPDAHDFTTAEVVGSLLFTIAQVRADEDLDPTRFPSTVVRATRDVVEIEFERITGRSFTRRTALLELTHDGSGSDILPLFDTWRVNAVKGPDGIEDLANFWLDEDGTLTGFPKAGRYSVNVAYGFRTVPDDIRRAGLLRLRYLLLADRSAVPDRATSFQPADGGGIYSLATPGRNGWETGVPDVDAVLARYTYKILRDVLGV